MNGIRNKVQLIGHLGQAPDIRNAGGDRKVANLKLATDEIYYDVNGEKITDTQLHAVVVWGRLAEIAVKYLVKGIEIAVEGKLVNRQYVDGNGNRHLVTEVQANRLLILSKRS